MRMSEWKLSKKFLLTFFPRVKAKVKLYSRRLSLLVFLIVMETVRYGSLAGAERAPWRAHSVGRATVLGVGVGTRCGDLLDCFYARYKLYKWTGL